MLGRAHKLIVSDARLISRLTDTPDSVCGSCGIISKPHLAGSCCGPWETVTFTTMPTLMIAQVGSRKKDGVADVGQTVKWKTCEG